MKMYFLLALILGSMASYAQQSQACCVSKPSCQIITCESKSSSETLEKAEPKTASINSNLAEAKSGGIFLFSTLITNAFAMLSKITCDPATCDPGNCLPEGTPPACEPAKCKTESCKK